MKRLLMILLCAVLGLQVSAREVLPLNKGWHFYFKSENTSDNARYVELPHSWNTAARSGGSWLETTGNYCNELYIPSEWSSQRLFLKFYGVQSVADLFVNGNHVGTHRGGAAAFTFEITDFLRFGDSNVVLVVVSNAWRDDVLPTSTDVDLYGGIYRDVELIVTSPTAVSPLYYGSDGVLVHPRSVDSLHVAGDVEVHLTSKTENACLLTLEIAAPDGTTVYTRRQRARIDDKAVMVPFSFEHPELWGPATPALYQVRVKLGDERTVDSVAVRTGFRSIEVTPLGGFRLNGVRMPVRGVTLYHDNALGGMPTAEDYAADLATLRDMGANALRSAVMPHGRSLYEQCDELGILAWVDTPLQSAPFLGDLAYYAMPAFEQNGLDQLREIIVQHMNHPSVVMWGLFSCLRPRGDRVTPYLEKLNEAAHAIDASRPTVACSDQDGDLNFVPDLIVWRQQVGWDRGSVDDVSVWRDQLLKNWSHLRSGVCYGGSGFVGHTGRAVHALSRRNWMPEQKQTRFHEGYARNLQQDSLFWGVWINNLFDYGASRRPYGIEGSGLVSLDRKLRKDAYYLYRALWNGDSPTLYISDRRRRFGADSRQVFRIYSSVGAPVLTVGTDTVAVSEYAACQYLSDSVSVSGAVTVRAVAGELRDSVTVRPDKLLGPTRSQVLQRRAGLSRTN